MQLRIKMNDKSNRFVFWSVIIISALTLLPFLGNTDFTTKGEPREAVVAVSMLSQHNWILPINNGFDIPYKPPFFQWCIAAFSLVTGHVSEFTSRLPSALSLMIMLCVGALFYAKRKNNNVSLLAAIITLTAFEVHRAGTNCRVDMVLTMFTVCALYALYKWWEKGCRQLPWMAMLCMSGATLTKGPVGIVLPCFVMFVFMLFTAWQQGKLCGKIIWKTTYKLFLSAVLASVLPILWYWAAYRQGGNQFMALVMDENVGRFLGKMKAVTHDNPWPYNILMLITGWLPWTLPLLLSLFVLPWRRFANSIQSKDENSGKATWVNRMVTAMRKADAVQVFTWLSFLLILFFYCIPKSKRGVYLLPCYPFMAVLIVEYVIWLVKRSLFPIRFYIGFLSIVGFLLTVTLVVVRAGMVPDSIFHGKHAWENIQMLHALSDGSMNFGDILMALMPLLAACLGLMTLTRRRSCFVTAHPVLASMVLTLLIYLSFDGYYKPSVMGCQSLRPVATQVEQAAKGEPVYALTTINKREVGDDVLRLYGIDFYLGDRVRQLDVDRPRKGIVVVPAQCKPLLREPFTKQYSFKEIMRTEHRASCFKDTIYVYRFARR